MGDLLILTGKIAIPATDVKRQTFRRWIGRFTGNPKAQHNRRVKLSRGHDDRGRGEKSEA
jgi:hypothetical protein